MDIHIVRNNLTGLSVARNPFLSMLKDSLINGRLSLV
ncbi:hypothetical protein EPIR_2306 [Erwinia piriflorinigrans CFBP 5888]|uniref:Uncharacterized protein n=1 Tax=Erwinia piriflorinigrans CFBP 5888 TaxID=1161919 RepID=V5Z9G6_9GAMM|nr:hypothetical protein EPIR_2306 [Erwinia piriflorinigrans CFBP 5888]